MTTPADPFISSTTLPLVALRGNRAGYIQLAPAANVQTYAQLPPSLFAAAQAWAATLQAQGAPRVYWITLSEVVHHLHIHLYPRWPQDSLSGIPLFEARDTLPQPPWPQSLQAALADWAQQHGVHLLP